MIARNDEYLGDAVYASFDGDHIWLRTRGDNDQLIALSPEVFARLIEYEREHHTKPASAPPQPERTGRGEYVDEALRVIRSTNTQTHPPAKMWAQRYLDAITARTNTGEPK